MVQRMGTEETAGSDTRHPFPMKDAMSRPYVNVIRMHLLIFFFAFCHALKLDNFLVYAVVYSVYFFPWSELRGWPAPRSGHAKVASAPQDAHPERVTSLSEP